MELGHVLPTLVFPTKLLCSKINEQFDNNCASDVFTVYRQIIL